MFPGTDAGRSLNSSPVAPLALLLEEDAGETTSVTFQRDRFPTSGVLSSVPTTVTLSSFPVDNSPRVRLNGLTLDEGVEYVIDDAVITLMSGVVSVGDVIDVRYALRDGDTPDPDELVPPADLFKDYHPPDCPAAENFFGSDGLFGMPVGETRYAVEASFGTPGPQPISIARLVYDDTHIAGWWMDPVTGCISTASIASGEGYPFPMTYIGEFSSFAPAGYVLVRLMAVSVISGVSTIVLDVGGWPE
jgi:hypothetical protein